MSERLEGCRCLLMKSGSPDCSTGRWIFADVEMTEGENVVIFDKSPFQNLPFPRFCSKKFKFSGFVQAGRSSILQRSIAAALMLPKFPTGIEI
jgi:hypothetical protein